MPAELLGLMTKNKRKQLGKMPNIKSPGPGGIPGFWMKQFEILSTNTTPEHSMDLSKRNRKWMNGSWRVTPSSSQNQMKPNDLANIGQ